MGRGLCISVEGRPWFILIKRSDLKEDPQFGELHGSNVGPSTICQFIPNWQSLNWEHPSLEPISSESFSRDGEYRINLVYPADGSVTADQVESDFIKYMSRN